MKKAILLIAALLMVGSMAFAVDIGCWGRTVFQLAGGSTDSRVTSVYAGWGPNWWGSTRMGVNMSFSSKVLSFKITTYYNGSQSGTGENVTTGNVNLSNMYGSVKVIPDLFTVYVGYMNGDGYDDYRKTQPNPNSDMNNNLGRMAGWGLWLTLAPKDLGLSVTANVMTAAPGTQQPFGAATGTVHWSMLGGFDREYDWVYLLHNINVAASYTIPDIVKITAAFMNQYGGSATRVATPSTSSAYEIYARFDVLAIQGMTLWLDGAFTGFETAAYRLQLDLGFGYRIGDLGLYLAATSGIPFTGTNPSVSIGANLEAQYTIKPITVGLIAAISTSTAANADIALEFQPYVSLDDLSLRIAFDYEMHTAAGNANYWCVPVFFTFSF